MPFSASLVSSNPIALEGLRRIIGSEDFQVLSTSLKMNELDFTETALPDLVIIELSTCEEQIEAVEVVSALGRCKPVILAGTLDVAVMTACFAKGAQGYLVKDMSCSTLLAALRLAALGQKVMPSDLADMLPRDWFVSTDSVADHDEFPDGKLSQRECDVLNCLVDGDPNKIIARKLQVSEATIKVHVKAILRKLNVLNRTQAAIWAQSRGAGVSARAGAC